MQLTPRRLRWMLNLYPPFWFTGISVRRISPDWRELDVQMALRFYNRNFVGTQFGGSLYSMTDPHVMIMLLQLLGRDYIVWDQAARIDFLRPGRAEVSCAVRITDEDLQRIRANTAEGQPYRTDFLLDVVDPAGETVARVTKTIYVRRKRAASEG